MFTIIKVIALVCMLSATNETCDRIIYIENPAQEVEFEATKAYFVDGEKITELKVVNFEEAD